jgi:hypothetical protein
MLFIFLAIARSTLLPVFSCASFAAFATLAAVCALSFAIIVVELSAATALISVISAGVSPKTFPSTSIFAIKLLFQITFSLSFN